MLKLTLAALLLGAASTAPPDLPPACRVTALSRPAPGLDSVFDGVPFRYITILNTPAPCPVAFVRLGNYGGRLPGSTLPLLPGNQVTFGPVPLYRTAERVLPSGKVFVIPISPGGAP